MKETIYTVTVPATLSFDVRAKSKEEAQAKARVEVARRHGQWTADELLTELTSGFVLVESTDLEVVDEYTPEEET